MKRLYIYITFFLLLIIFNNSLAQAISNQQSAISNQQSAISNQQSAISNQQSAISNQQSAISNQQSAISNQQSAISNQQSAISNQQSAISNQQSANKILNPQRYLKVVRHKIDKYENRISSKTEKTLTKLARWETKIHHLLQAVNPQAAEKLFGNGQQTFASLLQKMKEGKTLLDGYKAQYNEYTDKLETNVKYITTFYDSASKNYQLAKKIASSPKGKQSDALEAFIKERKTQLINQATQYIGNSKYLTKINKEAYYYVETLRNYKELFNNPQKAEELAYKILNQIQGFKDFATKNSMLASFFPSMAFFSGNSGAASVPIVNGFAARATLQQFMQQNMALQKNPIEQIQSQITDGKSAVNEWKTQLDQYTKKGNAKNQFSFKPNTQKTKTFAQRLQYGTDFQFGSSNQYLPSTANLALSVGYKLNDKSIVGFGLNYKMGLGSEWDKISISHQGIGFKTFIKWKMTKGFDIQGGSEWNYGHQFKQLQQLKSHNNWQQMALIGISKNYNVSKKMQGNMQLLYDVLAYKHTPVSQPIIFRIGYTF